MTNKRIYTSDSKDKVYHFAACPYAKRINPAHSQRQTRTSLEQLGYRPCKCCNSMAYHFRQNLDTITAFTKGKNIDIDLMEGEVTVRTAVSVWRIVYNADAQVFILWHKNSRGEEGWHRQMDKPTAKSLMEYVRYIYRHDLFRQAEAEGVNMKVDKKYERKVRMTQERKEAYRLDSLFEQIEAENREYRALSYC